MPRRSIAVGKEDGVMLAFLFAAFALDDGAIAWGGNPQLLKGHPSVSMNSEEVLITVTDKKVHVSCKFVFQNHGPACSVRMGFPDDGEGGYMSDYEERRGAAKDKGKPVPKFTAFDYFKSFVDGKKVPVELVAASGGSGSWHAKTVTFSNGQVRTIRDEYGLGLGGGFTSAGGYISNARYVLHTGASWKGPIGYAKIVVNFGAKGLAGTSRPFPVSSLPGGSAWDFKGWARVSKSRLYYQGPSVPRVSGKTVTFVRRNFEPKPKDDIDLYFGFVPYKPG